MGLGKGVLYILAFFVIFIVNIFFIFAINFILGVIVLIFALYLFVKGISEGNKR